MLNWPGSIGPAFASLSFALARASQLAYCALRPGDYPRLEPPKNCRRDSFTARPAIGRRVIATPAFRREKSAKSEFTRTEGEGVRVINEVHRSTYRGNTCVQKGSCISFAIARTERVILSFFTNAATSCALYMYVFLYIC